MRSRDELLDIIENAAHFLAGAAFDWSIPEPPRVALKFKSDSLYKIVNEEMTEDNNAG